jgi:hypothetical protein
MERQADLEPLLSGVTIDSLEAALRLPGGPAVIRALIQEPRTPWVVRGGEMAPTHPLDE